jgi:formylglycine-generating enzyme required for sulfatase activity
MLDVQGGPFTENQVLPWIEQICDALSYLHSQNPPIIHRDIKPSNIKITTGGVAMLVDFGAAKVFDPKLRTTIGARAITPGYSPLEQYGQGKTDARTDVYALGATLYTLLTGKEPAESITRMIKDPLIPAENFNPKISPHLANVIKKAMESDPDLRYQNTSELKTSLRTAPSLGSTLHIPVSDPAPAQVSKPLPAPGFTRWYPWGAGLIIFALVVTIIVLVNKAGEGEKSPDTRAIAGDIEPSSTPFPSTPTPSPIPPSPTATEFPSEVIDSFGVPMVLIPAGAFTMGGTIDSAMVECGKVYEPFSDIECEKSPFEDEEPVHTVTLGNYYIDKYETTNGRYAECVGEGFCDPPSETSSESRSNYYGNSHYEDYPVIYVSWDAADTYCSWRGTRLPTEAEWEKDARGTDGRIYPWGNTFLGIQANFCDQTCDYNWANTGYDDGNNDTAPVGSYPGGASPYGVLDMSGNVWEWVMDRYDSGYYTRSPARDPQGPSEGERRVARGGGWWDTGINLRMVMRVGYEQSAESYALGFRCAASVGP